MERPVGDLLVYRGAVGASVGGLDHEVREGPDAEARAWSTQHDKEEVRRLRSSCANTMVFAIKLLSDGDLRRINRGICDLVAPTRLWHGAQSQTNRSAHESFAFFRDMASPRCLEHLQATMEVLQQPSFWERVGVDSRASPVPPPLDAEHPAILEQNDVASTLAEFTFALIARRMSSLSWHLGYPGRLAALANPDESSSVAEAMKRDWQAWQHIGTLDGAFWSRFRKRSCMQFFVNSSRYSGQRRAETGHRGPLVGWAPLGSSDLGFLGGACQLRLALWPCASSMGLQGCSAALSPSMLVLVILLRLSAFGVCFFFGQSK